MRQDPLNFYLKLSLFTVVIVVVYYERRTYYCTSRFLSSLHHNITGHRRGGNTQRHEYTGSIGHANIFLGLLLLYRPCLRSRHAKTARGAAVVAAWAATRTSAGVGAAQEPARGARRRCRRGHIRGGDHDRLAVRHDRRRGLRRTRVRLAVPVRLAAPAAVGSKTAVKARRAALLRRRLLCRRCSRRARL